MSISRPGRYDLTGDAAILPGYGFYRQFTLKDEANVVLNLTGATVRVIGARSSAPDSEEIFNETLVVSAPLTGVAIWNWDETDTADLPLVTGAYWKLEVEPASGPPNIYLVGAVDIGENHLR